MYDRKPDANHSSAPREATLPPYQGPPVNGRSKYTPEPVDPQLTKTFLPDYQPRSNANAPGARANGGGAQGRAQYANVPAPSEYANIPQQANPYGVPISANRVDGAPQSGPHAAEYANIPQQHANGAQAPVPQARSNRPLPPLPKQDVYSGDGVDRIVTETNDRTKPQNDNARQWRALGEVERFQGRIVMEKPNHVMVMRMADPADNGRETLVHLPPSASQQLRADEFAAPFINESIRNGSQSKPLDLHYEQGKWSMTHPHADQKLSK